MTDPAQDLSDPSCETLDLCFTRPDLLRDLLGQLLKDFKTAQVPLDLDVQERYSFEALRDFVQMNLEAHLDANGSLKNLLNRVDLTEKQVKRAIPNQLGQHLRVLSELIIKRELQKVVIRHWYRSQAQPEE
jgi:hypothetical protein